MTRGSVVTFLLLLLILCTQAFNVTHFGDGHSQKRASSRLDAVRYGYQWTAVVKCSLAYFEIERVQQTLTASASLASQLTVSEARADDAAVPCTLTQSVQGLRRTVFVITCTDNTTSANIETRLRTFMQKPDYQVLPSDCSIDLSVSRDRVLRLRAQTQLLSGYWHLDRLDSRTLSLNNLYVYNRTGAGVTVYVLDSGLRATHVDFGGRATNVINLVGDGINTDCNGHGTHVSSTCCGTTYGVAKEATIKSIKVIGCDGSGSFSSVMTGLTYVEDAYLASPHSAVVSMSLAGGLYTPVHDMISDLVNTYKIGVAVAAGNSGTNACLFSPAAAAAALTVAASTNTDGLASFSNRGPCCDVAAPGMSIIAASYTGDTNPATMSGTSMATPQVAGVLALLLEDQGVSVGDGKKAQTDLLAMASANLIDDRTDAYASLPLLFSSVGFADVPQLAPPPPNPPPSQPSTGGGGLPSSSATVVFPQPIRTTLPDGISNNPNPNAATTALLINALGHPFFLFFLFWYIL